MIHIFIINPHSFPGEGALGEIMAEIDSCFTEEDAGNYFLHVSRYPRDAMVIIRKYLMTIPETETVRVYAVGGDGILFDCLNGIVGIPNAELASVPYGNANDVIRAFGEDKTDLFRNIRFQAASKTVPMDVIHCGNHYAINFCAFGLESDVIRNSRDIFSAITGKIKQFYGLRRFLYSLFPILNGMKAVFNRKILDQYYTITVDGEDMSGVYGAVNIANSPCYGGNRCAVPTAMPDDGILDAVFFHGGLPSLKAASLIVPYTSGQFRRFPHNFMWKRGRKFEIHSNEPLLIMLDGELFSDTSITVEIIPAGIRFVSPGGFPFYKRMDADERDE
jgi:diacylglycerol kinase family enzyme